MGIYQAEYSLGGNYIRQNFLYWNNPSQNFPAGNYHGWQILQVDIVRVGVILGGNCPGGNYRGGSCLGWELSWVGIFFGGNHLGGNFADGSFHATDFSVAFQILL